MSRFSRIVLGTLISFGVIIGIYTSVLGAPLTSRQERIGSHLVSGAKVNLDHFREAQIPSQIHQQSGRGCDSDSYTGLDD